MIRVEAFLAEARDGVMHAEHSDTREKLVNLEDVSTRGGMVNSRRRGQIENMHTTISALVLVLVGCSSSTSETAPFSACALGELHGTWRISYVETSGTCGDVPDETVVAGADAGAQTSCRYDTMQVSADKCRMDMDFTCPLVGQSGEQHWTGTLRQTANGRLEGSSTVQATSPEVVCRSTYNVTWTRQ